ncbi:TetR/AcrR family transcriptional regulator [Rhodoblastus sp.]|uniref:TetR/AcrR family transcriptional regulator n=1 Tax=Rhodoblastus sp. TaxID=1962975 RepID=UPI00261DFE3E|nr:TetR/AcrR family transcriptional regulator [Rhodoblastus sp.]
MTRSSPRERIIESARDLFRKHGLRGVGVDAIAEAAGTNKMTLYRHFGSKDELIAACLSRAGEEAQEDWSDLSAQFPGDARKQLHAWIQMATACALDDPRGCDIANAAVELTEADHPARKVIEQFKTDYRNRLAELCSQAGAGEADLLADALCLLMEGARVSWQSVGPNGPASHFVRISEAVVEAFTRQSRDEHLVQPPA